MSEPRCTVKSQVLPGGVRAIQLRNPFIEVMILPDKGADIYALVDRASGIDLLWKSPSGLRPPNTGWLSADSAVAWLEQYEGGWQEIFPNGGSMNVYKGVELNFHGEASMSSWQSEILQATDSVVEVLFSATLYRSPFRLARTMRLTADSATLRISETVFNLANEPMEFMWGHHPAYGAPFLSEHARLLTNARSITADADTESPDNVLRPGAQTTWPHALGKNGKLVDMQVVPGPHTPRMTLAHLSDFDGDPYYAIINPALELGVGWSWTPSVFPYLWLWQESHSSGGFPFYKRCYTMAVEPFSSIPAHGLGRAINETHSQLTLLAGTQLSCDLVVSLFTISSTQMVERLEQDGTVILR